MCALSCVRARAWQDLFELPSSSTYTTLQTSKYSTHQTVDGAVAPAQAPPSDVGLAAVIAELCSGTDMYKYKTGGGGRHIRHFQIRGIGVDTALAWRNPGWLSLRKERSVLLRDVVAIHYARGDLEWHRCAPIDAWRTCMCMPRLVCTRSRVHTRTHTRAHARGRHPGLSQPGDAYCFTVQYRESTSPSTSHNNSGSADAAGLHTMLYYQHKYIYKLHYTTCMCRSGRAGGA